MADNKLPESIPCPHCNKENCVEQYHLSAPSLGDPIRLGFTRPDNGWKEVLQKIQEKTPYGKYDAKLSDTSSLTRL